MVAMSNSTMFISKLGFAGFKTLSRTSVKTFTRTDILKNTMTIRHEKQDETDCAYVAYAPNDKPQDVLLKTLIDVKNTNRTTPGEVLELPLQSSIINAKKAAILHFQKKYLCKRTGSFALNPSGLLLDPFDVITLDDTAYGTLNVVIDSVDIAKDGKVTISFSQFQQYDDWVSLSNPSTDTIDDVELVNLYSGVIVGDDGPGQNTITGRMRVGKDHNNCIIIDPAGGGAGKEAYRMWIGNFDPDSAAFTIKKDGSFHAGDNNDFIEFNKSEGYLHAQFRKEDSPGLIIGDLDISTDPYTGNGWQMNKRGLFSWVEVDSNTYDAHAFNLISNQPWQTEGHGVMPVYDPNFELNPGDVVLGVFNLGHGIWFQQWDEVDLRSKLHIRGDIIVSGSNISAPNMPLNALSHEIFITAEQMQSAATNGAVSALIDYTTNAGLKRKVFELAAGTGIESHGKLLEWNGVDAWIERAPRLNIETVTFNLINFKNKTFCRSSRSKCRKRNSKS